MSKKPDFLNKADTLLDILRGGEQFLEGVGIADPLTNVERLLSHHFAKSRLEIYLHKDVTLTDEDKAQLGHLIMERAGNRPLQYVVNGTEFFFLSLKTDERALIPRPETEVLVSLAIDMAKTIADVPIRIADCGTGSGCMAVALAVNLSKARVIATDISQDALDLAKENARLYRVAKRIQFRKGDFLVPLLRAKNRFHILVCNPPYVSADEYASLTSDVRDHEPKIALWGGEDGLDFYRRAAVDVHGVLVSGGFFFFEVGLGQASDVIKLFKSNPRVSFCNTKKDLRGIDRVVYGQVSS